MHRYSRIAGAAFLALAHVVTASSPAGAQTRAPMASGDRVLVGTEAGERHEGLVTSVSSTQLELRTEGGGDPVVVRVPSITELSVRRQRSRALPGALIGAGTGVLAGLALCAGGDRCVYTHLNGGRNDFSSELPPILGVAGGVVGFFIGRRMKSEAWVGIPLDRLRVDLVPGSDGRLGIAFAPKWER